MGMMLRTWEFYFIVYVITINIYGFAIMGIDKWKARKRVRRISEKALFMAAFLGGAAGVFLGMRKFRHKTLHNKFKYGIPALIVVNVTVVIYIISFLG